MRGPSGAAFLVWSVWLAMLAAALFFVLRFGSNVPTRDDWDLVPIFTGQQPVTAEWLWSQHNEHRVPVPRLLMLALARLTVVDFRVLMVANVLAMGGAAAAMIASVRRIRGATRITDVVFPVLLLHWGQAENLLWGWQLQYFLPTVMAAAILTAVVGCPPHAQSLGADIGVGLCLLVLPLCGGNGLVLVPALALWLGYTAWLRWRSDERDWRGAVLLAALAAGALALVALYLVGWEHVPWHPRSKGLGQTLIGTLQFLVIGFGPAARAAWPASALAALVVLGVTGLRLAHVWRDRPHERRRAAGLLLYLGAIASLALVIGMGRANFETRYATLALPAWCCAYFAWTMYGSARSRPWLPGIITVAALASFWPNTGYGLTYARGLRSHLAAFEQDLAAGLPSHELIRRHGGHLAPHHDTVHDYLPMLRDAGVGAYPLLRPDPPFREVLVDLRPARTHGLHWSGDTATIVGSPDRSWPFEDWPFIIFTMPADVRAAGIRLAYRFRDPAGDLPYVGLAWKGLDQSQFRWQSSYKYSPTGDRATWERGTWPRRHQAETTVTVWIGDTVGEIKLILSDQPGATFRITRLALLVHAD